MNAEDTPPSATLTNFSTPGTNYFDSPHMVHSTDTSPMFQDDELGDESESWSSLFPNESPAGNTIDADYLPQTPDMKREKSSPGQSHTRHSSVAGVKARKRDKPLEDLSAKMHLETDPVARKRIKNTEAARKSRAKKTDNLNTMQQRIYDLEAEVRHWKAKALQTNPNQF